jgi:phosphate transport system substrate-binding protein
MMKKTGALIVCVFIIVLAVYPQAKKEIVAIDSASAISPIVYEFVKYCEKLRSDVQFVVTKSNAKHAAESLINGSCVIAAESRFLTTAEYKAAMEKQVYPVSYMIAMDGQVALVHKDNPLKGVSLDQLRLIFKGEIKNWKEIGGNDLGIVKINREQGAGQLDVFNTLVMKNDKMDPIHLTATSDSEVKKIVKGNPAAIGYSSLGFVDGTVKALEINQVYPDFLSIRGGLYPLSRPLFLFTNGLPAPSSPVYTFVSLYLYKDAQKIIEDAGFIPVTNY